MFYGRRLGMARQEIMVTRYGELLDMIACLAIYEGRAEPAPEKKKMSYDEVMNLR